MSCTREHGIEDIPAVRLATLESDGDLTVLREDASEVAAGPSTASRAG